LSEKNEEEGQAQQLLVKAQYHWTYPCRSFWVAGTQGPEQMVLYLTKMESQHEQFQMVLCLGSTLLQQIVKQRAAAPQITVAVVMTMPPAQNEAKSLQLIRDMGLKMRAGLLL
jgi:hypothetical protein